MWSIIYNILTILLTITIVLGITLYLYIKKCFTYWSKLGVPHPKPCFPLGNMKPNFSKYIGQAVAEIYQSMKNQGADYCGYYMFGMPVFMPISTKLIKQILGKSFHNFTDRGFHYDEKNDPMGASLLTFNGDKWKRMREKLSPTFTVSRTKSMLPIVLACTKELDNIFDVASQTSEAIDIQDIAKRYTVDVICSSAFGVNGNSLKDPNSKYLYYGLKVFSADLIDNIRLALGQSAPSLLKLFKIELFNPSATGFFRDVVLQTLEYRKKNNINRNDFIDSLIRLKNEDKKTNYHNNEFKDEDEITDNVIAANCFVFFLAGFETSATTITFTLYEIALNEELQEKLRQDINEALEQTGGEITYKTVMDIRSLDNVFNESLRKYPTVHMINRKCTEDFKIPDTDVVIKKGTMAVITSLGLHRDPELYPDPEKFDPERFSDEEKRKRPPYAYLPFGDGPRICPGLIFGMAETKFAIAMILTKYKIKVHPSVPQNLTLISLGNVLATKEKILLTAEKI